ncbi:hypothetical protein EPD60_14130 [Flaviaesturariibacter flavus]|uniref:Glycosyltransferase RgtA/B/C/D-like domain-containing protein n=1 Tax=Flaviaesturariibacter flavus TaxID=2502780 RepID=A0A4R1B3I4_9BACT|nr:DUF3488 domain-containing protein [Flaviaesturariibacter flavus]TCJ12411.1 hypothetical protein EPD60_14130 [Flaviaesturariibacter flavus]
MPATKTFSRNCYLIAAAWILLTGFFYYPKWNKPTSEASISWDINGYYFYLPATLIYHDLKQQAFKDSITQRYNPTPGGYQSYHDSASGNMVMKYSGGMAFAYLPFFAAGHAVALMSHYPADGYSPPYQYAIGIGSLLVSLLGLHLLRRLLDRYFSPYATGIVLLLYVFGTNYLEYAAITNAMTHSYLFTMYGALLLLTIRYYEAPTALRAAALGLLVGWMALIRPTEIWSAFLPLAWGIGSARELRMRVQLLVANWRHLLLFAASAAAVGSIQLFYWKYVTGHWLEYSYQGEGFDFGSPHYAQCLWGFQKGWFVYTPLMVLSVIGFAALWRKDRGLFWPVLLFTLGFTYLAFSWSIWWYGGGLGQRALVQLYPVLAFPLAALLERARRRWMQGLLAAFSLLCITYNLWLHHQGHRGGLLEPEFMTYGYWKKIVFRGSVPFETRKLLDAEYEYEGTPACAETTISRNDTLVLPGVAGYTDVGISRPLMGKGWVRTYITATTADPEADIWKQHMLYMHEIKDGATIGINQLRVERLLPGGGTRTLWLDLKLHDERDSVKVFFYNPGTPKQLIITAIKTVAF